MEKKQHILKTISTLLLLSLMVHLTPKPVEAFFGIQDFEQHINIINIEYNDTTGSFGPTDNSLGLISFDSANYDGDTVYFEAIIKCDSCTGGGNNRAVAGLYNDTGTSVTSVSTTNSTYTRVRSGSISISADEYTVRLQRDDDAGTAYILAARLVITQSSTSGITDTETHVEVGSNESTTNTSATQLTAPKFYVYDHSKFSGTVNSYFEATLLSDGTNTSYAELYNVTNSAVVATVSTTNNTYTRVRSSALSTNWDTSNSDEYVVRIYSSDGANTAYISNAKIVIDQNETNGIKKIEIPFQMINSTTTETATSDTENNFFIEYDPSNFYTKHTRKLYHEATMQTSGGTGYINLYNTSDSDEIDSPTPTELSTTSTSFERQISSNFTSNTDWPTATKNLDQNLRASSGETTTVSSSRLLIEIANIDPSVTFSIAGEASGNTHNGITTTITTTATGIDFGAVAPGSPEYGSHILTIGTNDANSTYIVTLELESTFQGLYPANVIDPFVGSSATWSSPQTWSSPTSTTKNQNTGWFGANTTDEDVSGWGSAANKFGPIDTNPVTVMQSNPASSKTEYVTFGFEVNNYQPSDAYSVNMIYNIIPTF